MEIECHISAFRRQKHEKIKRNKKKPKEIKVYMKKEMQTEWREREIEREGKKSEQPKRYVKYISSNKSVIIQPELSWLYGIKGTGV